MTNEDIVLSIETLKEYTSGMIKKCQEAVLLSVESMVNRNLEQQFIDKLCLLNLKK